MDKRTILAFVLSFLILLIYSLFFTPKQEKIPQKDEARDVEVPAEMAKPRKAPDVSPGLTETAQEKIAAVPTGRIEERLIEIETPLYTAVLNNIGPTFKSFKLKKYRQTVHQDSPSIELVNVDETSGAFLNIHFSDGVRDQNTNTVYQVNKEKITLGLDSSPEELIFQSSTPGGFNYEKILRFYPNQYRIDVAFSVENRTEQPTNGSFLARLRAMPPKKKVSYYSYVGLAMLLDDDLEEVEIEDPSEEKVLTGKIDWIAYEDDYFISAVIPEQPSQATFKAGMLPSGTLEGVYTSPILSVNPYQRVGAQFMLYLGPRDLDTLEQLGKNLSRAVNFGWTDIIARPLLFLLRFFEKYIHNWGVSIILLTILVKILFWPLTHKSYKSMKEMQKLQPRMAKIREKHKGNREQMNKEMMALYKTYKVNPMSGCLPMIIQLPVFFALFRILGSAIELRHAPFLLWIQDLSAPDRLFNFPFTIPFMSPPYGIPVLTLLMGASMFIQQKMTPTPGDPTQAKIMMFLPIIFTVMFINFPSGLVLYWLTNNLLSIGQQYRIHKG